jgi:hypothetical protein
MAELAAQLSAENTAVSAVEADAPKTLAELKQAKEVAKRATDAAQHRYFAAVAEGTGEEETQAEIDLHATWKACKQAEVNAIGAYYDALRTQPKDPNDKDECCDGVSCLG